ncbi:MAG: TonB-dependent receptor plug domain-containing protein [Flavobacteriaceae bacterium]
MSLRVKAFYACMLLAAHAIAQDEVDGNFQLQELDEVVVSDSRFELKREYSGKTVIKIDSLELSQYQGRSIAEIINQKSGIEIVGSRSRQGEVLGVFARGGRGRQVLVIIDGVRVTDPSSFSQEYDLRLLPTSQVASIEIIKGAASTLYGANAATAVINIKTKAASKSKIGGELQSSLGTNQTAADQNYNIAEFVNSAALGGTLDRFKYSINFAQTFVNGLSSIETDENEEDSTSKYSTNIKLGYKFSDELELGIYGNQSRLDTDYDESFGLMDAPYRFRSDQRRLGLTGNWVLEKGEIVLNTAISDYTSENISAFPSTFKGKNYVADLFGKYVFEETFYALLGLNYVDDRAEFVEIEKFTLLDPYANVVYVSGTGLNINGGIRLNNHSEYGTHFVYNLNPSYVFKLDQGYIKALASYATSYITPSLTQLFGEFGANPELEPETNRTIETGVEYVCNKNLRASLVYFNRIEENFVFFDNIDFIYLNAENSIEAQGVEFELRWKLLDALLLDANYTFTERKGDSAIRIPKHKINASAAYTITSNTFLSISYSYTGMRTDTDFNTFTNVSLEPYSLFGFLLSHELLPKRLKVFISFDNFFNTEFTEVVGFNTRGRNMRLGLALKL